MQEKTSKTCGLLYGGRGNASDVLKQKNHETCIEKYGVDHPWKDDSIHAKTIAKTRELYGGNTWEVSSSLRVVVDVTMLERYGTTKPMSSPEIKERYKQTMLANWGVEFPQQSEAIREKTKEVWMEHYGVDHPMKSDEVKAGIDWSEQRRKQNETFKIRGVWGSKPENEFGEWLASIFSEDDVKKQSWINCQSIDFYIVSIRTYVQFDGIYWHGLDKSYDDLASWIKDRFIRDRKMDDWFESKISDGWKLFRLTDEQWDRVKELAIFEDLRKELIGASPGVTYSALGAIYDRFGSISRFRSE
jgi:hypothetical protein